MVRAMYSGVSGLRNHQQRMDVISNNIANVNTNGYKGSRATFADMFSQTIRPATSASPANISGGVNPFQIGLGALSQTVDVVHTVGAFQSTERPLDLMIMGEGFFVVNNGPEPFFTRAGNLYLDDFGFLVNANGLYLMGLMLLTAEDWEGTSGENENPPTIEQTIRDRVIGGGEVERDSAIIWHESGKHDPEAMNHINNFIGGEDANFPLFRNHESTEALFPHYTAAGPQAGHIGEGNGQVLGRIVVPPYYSQLSIDQNGILRGVDENGNGVQIAVLTTARFLNPGGLTRMGDNLYAQSANSGEPAFSFPGMEEHGEVRAGGLEMSNVDLAAEFTNMIVTQRGYQANSRVITVSDTMLEELVNLKR